MDYNAYVASKVRLPKDGHTFATGKVIGRARDINGELIGKSNPNPLLDTSVFDVEMEGGAVERYSSNVIAEHIYSQIDDDGNNVYLLDEFIDHRKTKEAAPRTAETDEKCSQDNQGLGTTY